MGFARANRRRETRGTVGEGGKTVNSKVQKQAGKYRQVVAGGERYGPTCVT